MYDCGATVHCNITTLHCTQLQWRTQEIEPEVTSLCNKIPSRHFHEFTGFFQALETVG